MNLATFRSRAARVSGMSTSDSGDLALLDGWVNDAIEQFNRETKMNVALAKLAATIGVSDYALDVNILSMQALWYAPIDAQSALLQPLSPEALVQRRLMSGTQNSSPMYYALAGANTLMLWPAPRASTEYLHVLYVPRHTALSLTADVPSASANGNIPLEYHVVLEAYVKWKACEAEEHRPSEGGDKFAQQWQQGLAGAKADAKRKAGIVGPDVRIGRPRPAPLSNGVDYR